LRYNNSFKEEVYLNNMRKAILFMICLILLTGTVLAVDITTVGDWWGTVQINGEDGNGAVVDAYINNVKVASAIVGAIQPNYYLIHVEGTVGDSIVFKVNGKEATTQIWSNGDHELDLEVRTDITNDDNDGSGSSGGGGGGGGGTYTPSSSTPNDEGVIVLDEQEDEETEEVDEPEVLGEQTVGTGLGAVLGFVKSIKGLGLAFGVLMLALGITVFVTQRKKGKSNETSLSTE
jgi:hypothetical protein